MAQAWIGTSGFSYKEWKPIFYPQDLPEKQFLPYYAGKFNSVEIDYTFYRMPNAKTIEAWRVATPESFRFALKASEKITHHERLKTPSEALDYLVTIVQGLESRLGVLLFQLPPFFRYDHERLGAFLDVLPQQLPSAFEFRHPSWFVDDVYRLLEKKGVALCINDGDEATTPIHLTTRLTYVRLRKSEYPPALREDWQERIRDWVKNGIDVFAYIKHEDNPDAPLIASDFAKGLVP